MTTFKEKCLEYYGTSDFYEVLKVERGATEKEIKKAYHNLSLLVHPDRVDDNHKEVATEKFKVLGRIHAILQNKEKRRVYDDCGDFDEDTDATCNWMEYWRAMFKKIEIKDIEDYENQYVGSENEIEDIKRAYVASKGDMNKILEMVPFSNCDSEPRIMFIVSSLVDDGEVEEYEAFFNENKQKKMRRHKKWEKERQEAEKIDMKELEKEMEEGMKKRAQQFGDLISNLEEKYAPKKRKSITNGSASGSAEKKRGRTRTK